MSRSKCDAIRPMISAALDGDLDEDDFVQLSEHLAACPDCRQIHQDYTRLRDGLRTSPRPAPPPEIARNVWKETVEKPPPSAITRLVSRTGLRFGMSTMAASIVAVLVAVIFLAHGYDQRSIPAIASSQPEQESTQDWPISRPIEIQFSKTMNQKSVEDNLIIWPTAEQDRLPTMWSGNTLIIGRSEDRSVLLRPETDYRITILEHAEDRHGNTIGDFWVLQFRTGQPEVAISTPSPDVDRPERTLEEDQPPGSSWLFGQGDDGNDSNGGDEVDSSEAAPAPAEEAPSGPGSGETVNEPGDPVEDSVDANEEPTEEPTEAPTNTVEPEDQPESTPEPEPTEPEPTSEPEPSPTTRPDPTPQPTATPSPEPSPTPSPSPEPIGVQGAFGEVYWGNSSIQQALGEPTQNAYSFLAAEQEFQRGMMFRQYYQDRNSVFVFVNGGTVQMLDNVYDPDQHNFPVEPKDDGLYQPGGYFGKIWSENPELAQAIGFSVTSEPQEDIDAAIQQFRNGMLLYSRGSVYVIFADDTWDVFTVRSDSNGGFQGSEPDEGTPTPEEQTEDDSPTEGEDDSAEYQSSEDEEIGAEESTVESP